MKIHREGYTILLVTTIILVFINTVVIFWMDEYNWIGISCLIISLVVFLLFLQFFRYPSRELSFNEKYVVAPADGKVVVMEQTVEKEFFKDKRMMISIFMSPLNVHANWYPVSGKVKYLRYHYGKYLVAWHPKASTENERTTIVIERENNVAVLVR